MAFKIENPNNIQIDVLRTYVNRVAKRRILFYKETAKEKQLTDYLLRNYKLNLKTACLKLLKSAKLMKNYSNEIVVIFQNPEAERLARFITFGNGKIQGSQILRFAFCQN